MTCNMSYCYSSLTTHVHEFSIQNTKLSILKNLIWYKYITDLRYRKTNLSVYKLLLKFQSHKDEDEVKLCQHCFVINRGLKRLKNDQQWYRCARPVLHMVRVIFGLVWMCMSSYNETNIKVNLLLSLETSIKMESSSAERSEYEILHFTLML